MSQSTELNPNIWRRCDIQATATNSTNLQAVRLNPDVRLKFDPLSGSKIEEECTKTQLTMLSKLDAESLPIEPSNKLQTPLISELLASIASKSSLAKVRDESTILFSSSVGSGVICPTSSSPASARTGNNRLNPVIILKRLPVPTNCLEMINTNINSSQIVDGCKNRRQNRIRYGI